jgi:hypothetical protein
MKFEEIDTRTREFDGLYEQWLLAAHAADESLEAHGMNQASIALLAKADAIRHRLEELYAEFEAAVDGPSKLIH